MRKILCIMILSTFLLTACNRTYSGNSEIYREETTIITTEVQDVKSADMTAHASPEIYTLKKTSCTYTEYEIIMLAQVVWLEAGACEPSEQRLIVWTVFQRIDSSDHDFKDMNTIAETVTADGQFAYDPDAPVYKDILNLCREEAAKWADGQPPPTHEIYAPTSPYFFYSGDGSHNWFRAEWQ